MLVLGQTDWTVLELGGVQEQRAWSLWELEDLEVRKLAGCLPKGRRRRDRRQRGVHGHCLAH